MHACDLENEHVKRTCNSMKKVISHHKILLFPPELLQLRYFLGKSSFHQQVSSITFSLSS